MIFDVIFSRSHRGRVWIGDLPECEAPTVAVVDEVAIPGSHRTTAVSAAVELFWPVGPRSLYGLIGGSYTPFDSKFLHISINLAAPGGLPYKETLAWPIEEARCGLPPEYVNGVTAGLFREFLSISPPSGRLIITRAAHGKVGSCLEIFEHLGAVLSKILFSPIEQWSLEELQTILDWRHHRER